MNARSGDRERDFERVIARGLAATPSTAEACPTADLLAAWFDRALPPHEASAVEGHLSVCSRCQQVAVALAGSEPDTAEARPLVEPVRRPTWLWHWRWVVPVATAAILIVVVGSRTMHAPGETTAPASTQASTATPTAEAPVPTGAVAGGDVRDATGATGESSKPAPAPTRMARAELPSPPPASSFARQRAEAVVPEPAAARPADERLASNELAMADRPAPSPPQPLGAERPEEKGVSKAEKAAGVAHDAAMAPQAKQLAPAVPSNRVPPPAELRVVGGVEGIAQRPTTMAREKEDTAGGRTITLSAPGSPVAWRFGDGGVIERTADGRTWSRQISGVTTPLLAGWAVSSRICWIVGRDGVVLRTLDGLTWSQAEAPAPVHLVAVYARSAEEASVRTADGREFVTTDGGATWQRR